MNDSVFDLNYDGPNRQLWDELDRYPDKRDDMGRLVSEGRPKRHLANLVDIIAGDRRISERITFNSFAQRIEYKGVPIRDTDESAVALWVHRIYGLTASTTMVSEAVRVVADRQQRHPVKDYLCGLTWDGVKRLERFLPDYLGTSDDPLHREVGMRWAISCVARIHLAPCKVDTVLILVGPQGAFKSTAFRQMVPVPEWFSDTPIDIRNKDAYQAICGVWLYEMAELAAMRPRDAETVKAFLAAERDRYRPPYGRNMVDQVRQCVFVGTTNEQEFLGDPTGARRFWPVRVGHISLAAIQRDRDQLWAEAQDLLLNHERWHLDVNGAEELHRIQAEYKQVDPWEQLIEESAHLGPRTLQEIMAGTLKVEPDRQTKGMSMRVAAILAGAGWEKHRETILNSRAWRWYPPNP